MKALIRIAWFVYFAGLSTATHIPQMVIDGPIPRTDLVIHLVCFGGWCALFIACGFFGPALSKGNIVRAGAIAAVYALVDELTQGIPGINRVVDATDAAANVGGTILVSLGALGLSAMRKQREPEARPD